MFKMYLIPSTDLTRLRSGITAASIAMLLCGVASGQQSALSGNTTAPPPSTTKAPTGSALHQPYSPNNSGAAQTWQPENSGASALPSAAPSKQPASPAAGSASPAPSALEQPTQTKSGAASGASYIHSILNAPTTGHVSTNLATGSLVLPKQTLYRQPNPVKFDNAARQMTTEGYIVIDIPKGWQRSSGPGLIYCLPERGMLGTPEAEMYIGSAEIEGRPRDKDAIVFRSAAAFIQSDINGFKEQFANGVVTPDNALELPLTSSRYYVYSFQSGSKHNAFEEVVYVDEGTHVLALTLSAASYKAFRKELPSFYKFAQSFQGSIPFSAGARLQ